MGGGGGGGSRRKKRYEHERQGEEMGLGASFGKRVVALGLTPVFRPVLSLLCAAFASAGCYVRTYCCEQHRPRTTRRAPHTYPDI